ncbi:response regulator [Tropicimonas sp. TH_r6]|uniref:response regulator n=1 Tax=Tropicimonas sp. TH_r6 TaxID=3082085 RepID=UPI002955D048|nr:response regulator [Tropicimonas sp. TH_r6]MDV7142718.1 response regulator [Tropicimonas sp. TH_r6]
MSKSLAAVANRLRLQLRLLLFFLALPCIALIAWLAFQERQAVIETYLVRSEAVADALVKTQRELVNDTGSFLQEIALSAAAQAPSTPACGEYLASLLALHPEFANLGVPRADGEVLCSAVPLPGPVNVADRSYFQSALETRSISVGTYPGDESTRTAGLSFAYPVFDPSRPATPVGAVVAVISLDWWNNALRAAGLPDGSRAEITDPDGTVIARFPASTEPEALGQTPLARTGTSASLPSDRDGQQPVALQRVLIETATGDRIRMRLEMPFDDGLTAALDRARLRLFLLLAAIAGLWWLAKSRFERMVLAPLGATETEIQRLERAAPLVDNSATGATYDGGRIEGPDLDPLTEDLRDLWIQKRLAEDAEKATSLRLMALVSTLPDLFFRLNETGRIIDYQAGKESDLYLPPDAFLGRKMAELLPETTAAQFNRNLQRLAQEGVLQSWEYQLEVQGRLKDFDARACPIDDSTETLIVIRDITRRKEAERDRATAEFRLQEILADLPGAVISLDLTAPDALEIVYVSPGCQMIWGYDSSELMADLDLIHKAHDPDDAPLMRAALLNTAHTLEPETRRYWLRGRDGARKWVEVHIGATRLADGTHRVTTFVVDISREVEAEQQLDEQRELTFRAMKHESIGQLTGGVAHDFNNLLAVIMGNLELLRDGLCDPEQITLIDRGINAAQRGSELTRSMLAFARQARLDPVEIDLNQLVRDVHTWTDRTLPDNIRVETDLAEALGSVVADPASSEAALLNLILNARDAMPEGGTLTLRTRKLRIEAEAPQDTPDGLRPGRYVVLAVSDTGHGVSPEAQSQIFDPYFTTKPPGAGSGLGLPMVQGFMIQSGGAVKVRSEPGKGAVFELWFPAGERGASLAQDSETNGPEIRAGKHVLLAEDQDEVRQVVKTILTRAGYQVTAAENGDAARTLFETAPSCDLLLTDIQMPGTLQGPDLARALRAIRPDLPVVFMTGNAPDQEVAEDGTADTDIRLMKPVRRNELLTALNHAFTP